MHKFTVFIHGSMVRLTKAKSTTFTNFVRFAAVSFFLLIFESSRRIRVYYLLQHQCDSVIRIIALAEFTLLIIMVTMSAENVKGNGIQ